MAENRVVTNNPADKQFRVNDAEEFVGPPAPEVGTRTEAQNKDSGEKGFPIPIDKLPSIIMSILGAAGGIFGGGDERSQTSPPEELGAWGPHQQGMDWVEQAYNPIFNWDIPDSPYYTAWGNQISQRTGVTPEHERVAERRARQEQAYADQQQAPATGPGGVAPQVVYDQNGVPSAPGSPPGTQVTAGSGILEDPITRPPGTPVLPDPNDPRFPGGLGGGPFGGP